jgi:predicted phosphodiesterase
MKNIATAAAAAIIMAIDLVAATAATGPANVTIGILSDVHVGTSRAKVLEETFAFFRDAGVDGVIIAGDIANSGNSNELKSAGNAWDAVFPDNKAPDGRKVEKLFLYGNHDYFGNSIKSDPAAAWQYAFNEDWAPVYAKTVKGYVFICTHWGHEKKLAGFLAENEEKLHLRDGRPFFYSQHPHPGNTVYGPWAWGNDNGVATQALGTYSNAVVFSGHSHHSLTDERSVWQGAFTSIGTSSLSYIYAQYWRENGEAGRGEPVKQMPWLNAHAGKQGMVMRVCDDAIVIERWDMIAHQKVGADWRIPLDGSRPFDFEKRRAAAIPPEFAPDTPVMLSKGTGKNRKGEEVEQVTVTFPSAIPSATSRVLDYEVRALAYHEDMDYAVATKRIHAAAFYLPVERDAPTNKCVFATSELPEKTPLRFAVRPVECYGKKGHEILSGWWKR